MSARPPTRASDVAARQVEQIVAAAQEAAEQIREEARQELQEIRQRGEREAEKELTKARREAILLTQDARRDAEGILSDANAEVTQMREQTQRAVEGRVAAAEKAAAEVLAEARALSGGLTQLGRSLEAQADRILRDVTAAHKQMQADLRVGHVPEPSAPASSRGRGSDTPRGRPNPFDELEVPSWE